MNTTYKKGHTHTIVHTQQNTNMDARTERVCARIEGVHCAR